MTKLQAAEALAEAVRTILKDPLWVPNGAGHFAVRKRDVDKANEALAAYDAAPPDDRLEKVRAIVQGGRDQIAAIVAGMPPEKQAEYLREHDEALAILEGDTP